ncbi:MAG: sorbosone dehydrogenase [Planctomycetota bacterium]|nr:MAG: sorbosone dehydrogenase [Planctomycetota bacterium]
MTMLIRFLVPFIVFALSWQLALAQRDLKNIPVPDPELEKATFKVPEGFEVHLFASDPLIAKPIQMNFDEDGRLWIASSEVYPQIVPGAPATDRVVVVEDSDHNGVADKTHVFAEGLLIPTGVAPGDGGVWVANSTELLHFADHDGDLKADSKRVVLSGFGTEDTHHILHTLRWGYDGFLYFNQSIYIHSHVETPWGVRRLNAGGIWQFRPETLELGVFIKGLVNTWGHHYDRFGQSFATDGAGGEGINYMIPGGSYLTAADAERLVKGLNPGSPKHCGLELVDTPMLPPEWQGCAITNDFRGHRVVRFALTEEGSGYVSREQQEVIWSDHVAFRPIDVKIGPDGAIYIADWYNPIIQHGEVDFRDERRDHTHGRIWRVTWKGAPQREFKPVSTRTNPELFDALRSNDGVERQSAKQILRQRGPEIAAELEAWLKTVELSDEERDHVHLEALWCFQTARSLQPQLLESLLQSPDGRIRAAAVRVLSHWKYELPNSRELLTTAVQDVHSRVRLEAVRAFSFSPLEDSERQIADGSAFGEVNMESAQTVAAYRDPKLVETALLPLKQPVDLHLDYAMWLTTKELAPYWRPAFDLGEMNFNNDAGQIAYGFSALGSGAPVDVLIKDLYADHVTPEKRAGLIPLMCYSANANQMERLASDAVQRKDGATLQTLLAISLMRKIVPAINADTLAPWIKSDEATLRHAALQAIGQWNLAGLKPHLEALAGDSSADNADLAAAFAGIAVSHDDTLLALLETVGGNNKSSLESRSLALERLATARPEKAAPLIVDLVAALPEGTSAVNVARALLSGKQGAQLLTAALAGRELRTDVARDILRVLRESGRTDADLEHALRTAGKIISRKSLTVEERAAMLTKAATTATAAEGERIYRNEQLGCLKCHAIGGAGGLVGPDMISLGASAQPDYLLESLLNPNAKVKENYHTTVIATVDGRVVAGVLMQKSEKTLTLRTAENKVMEVPIAEIEEQAQGLSLMPEGLVDNLTDDEIASVVRFLSELGRTPEYTLSKSRLVRSWQVVMPTEQANFLLNRTSFSQVAADNPGFTWSPRYSMVAGQLPLETIPLMTARGVTVGFARCEVNVTTPGKIALRVNSIAGLEVRIDSIPMESAVEFSATLATGMHTITVMIEPAKRTDPLQLEVIDLQGGGNAELVNR